MARQLTEADRQMRAARRIHLADRTMTWSPLNTRFMILDHTLVLPAGGPTGPVRRSVAIIGASGTAHLAPLEDPEWEVWCLNLIPAYDNQDRVRADRWFDIHQWKAQSSDDLRWIAACPRPIYVPPDLIESGVNTVHFPLAGILRVAGEGAPFACTFAYQIALAILSGFTTIGLYGVELAIGTRRERTVEWASVNWWVGFARGLGITIVVPDGSRIGRHRFLYGFDYEEEINEVHAYLDDSMKYELYEIAKTKKNRVALRKWFDELDQGAELETGVGG